VENRSTGAGIASLLAVTVIWAFSFGIIGRYLAGVDSFWVAFVRLLIATLCFLPFLRLKKQGLGSCLTLVGIGMVQFGIMYVSYLAAFRTLEAWQVALFSVLTPVWVALVDSLFSRRWSVRIFLAAILAVAGAAVIRFGDVSSGGFWTGFLLMQIANLAFGFGQVWFREWKFRRPAISEREVFALVYGGGTVVAAIGSAISGSLFAIPSLEPSQWLALVYLGLIASGLGFFFWNYGASRVSVGFLAASNNLVVPVGIAVAIALTGREPEWTTLVLGAGLIVSGLFVGRKTKKSVNAL